MRENGRDSERRTTMGSIAWDRVAAIYDAYVAATFDIPFFLGHAQKTSGEVLELMCGTGRVSIPLAEAGIRLTCVDSSQEMLAVLREKLARRRLDTTVIRMDVRDLALGREFDLALLPFHSFAELTAEPDQRRALECIVAHVKTGGRFICALHNPRIRRATADGQLRLVGTYPLTDRDATLLLWATARCDPTGRVVEGMQFYEEYDADGVLQKKRLLEIRFALIERGEFEGLAAAAGFTTVALYGDYDGSPFHEETSPYMIWVLQK